MAKKKYYYKISKTQRNMLKPLYRNITKLRKYLIESKRAGNRSLGAESSRIVPDLVLPKQFSYYQKYKFESRKDYQERIGELKEYKSIQKYIRVNYKDKILKLYREDIIGEAPNGSNGQYTIEQIKGSELYGDIMEHYNKMNRMSSENFFDAYQKGYIKAFRYVYIDETVNPARRGYESQVSEAIELLDDYLKNSDYE